MVIGLRMHMTVCLMTQVVSFKRFIKGQIHVSQHQITRGLKQRYGTEKREPMAQRK